jgi:glycine/D-amino acid oxidase-like deaminating enzyme
MRTRYGLSPWVASVPASRRPSWPRLRGEHAASIVIVGGGLTGCATAYACAAAGLKPTLVEAGHIGRSGAGASAGLLLPDPGPSFRDTVERHGMRVARQVFETWRRATLDAAALLRRLGLRARLDTLDALVMAPPGGDRALRREWEARRAAGLAVQWHTPAQVRRAMRLDAAGGMGMHDAVGLDPYRACLTLATAATRRGATLAEQSPVHRIRRRPRTIEIVLEGATLHADQVVVATGIPTPLFAPLRRHFTPRETYLVLTEPLPAPLRREVEYPGVTLTDTRDPRHRVRWTRDHRILVAGADQGATPARGHEAVLVQRTGQLMYELLTMYPAISGLRPEFGWSVTAGETADGLPFIGPHRNYPRHLFALGGSGDSVTGAFLAARLLLRALRGEPDRADAILAMGR